MGPAMPPQGFRNRAESTYSPLSHLSNKSQILNKAPTPVNHSPLVQQQQKEAKQELNDSSVAPPSQSSLPVTRPLSRQQQQQQQTFIHQLPHLELTHYLIRCRTPSPSIVILMQRNSFNTVYEHQNC